MSPEQHPASIVRVPCLEGFDFGHDAVLAAMNAAGLDAFTAALNRAREQGFARLDSEGRIHTFGLQVGAADVDLDDGHDDHVEWRLDPDTAEEMIGKLTGMRNHGPCQFEPSSVVHTSPFGYF